MWNRRNRSEPDPQPVVDPMTEVRALLDKTGQARLRITSPRLKVLLSMIAQNGEEYLINRGLNGTPTVADIESLKFNLESLQTVLSAYVRIQGDPLTPDRDEYLDKGREAIEGLAHMIMSSTTSGAQAHLSEFRINAQILSAQRFR